MKLFLLFLLFLQAFAQESNFGIGGSLVPIPGITDRILERITNSLNPVLNEVRGLLTSLESNVNNLVTNLFKTLFDLVNNRISLVDALLEDAINSEKFVENCVLKISDLKLIEEKISGAVEKCRRNSNFEIESISTMINQQFEYGTGVISRLTQSLQDCLTRPLFTSCISKVQQSASNEIQAIIKNVDNLRQRISLASARLRRCINDVEKDGRQLVDQTYQEIQQCISEAPNI